MNALIKSKERVREHGEVFTPENLVKAMCDILPPEMFMPDKKFLEPSCGDGNFLAEILRRKLANSKTWMDALTRPIRNGTIDVGLHAPGILKRKHGGVERHANFYVKK